MARHEFGIMEDAPQQGQRYDASEPWAYACISVDDDFLEGIVERFGQIEFYWHTLDVKARGIAYCGITLIPPDSIRVFLDVIRDVAE